MQVLILTFCKEFNRNLSKCCRLKRTNLCAHNVFIFYVLLTVHLSIILGNGQLDTQLLDFTILFFMFLCMFRALYARIRRLNCIDAASGIVTLSNGCPVHRLREFSLNLCTGQPLTESDDTRCCINTIHPPDDEHIMLETCRGSQ